MLNRYRNELILTPEQFEPSDPRLKIIGVFNPGVARLADEIVLLVRAAEAPLEQRPGHTASPRLLPSRRPGPAYAIDYLKCKSASGGPAQIEDKELVRLPHISHFQIVRLDREGYRVRSIETHPDLYGSTAEEEFGIEDPRITEIDGVFFITYVTVSSVLNVCTSLMSTRDFKSFKRHGVIFPCENKDVIIHPGKFGKLYYCYHRPVGDMRFTQPSMVSASSENLTHWGDHRTFLTSGKTGAWDSTRIGGGTPPLKTQEGWLQLYHGVGPGKNQREYRAGAILTSLADPTKVERKSKSSVLSPEKDFEINGYISRVVFPTGWLTATGEADSVILYYGCADSGIAAVTLSIDEILKTLS